MVEQGLTQLIMAGLDDATIQTFPVQLPKDWISASRPKAITYRSILSTALYTLDGQDPLTNWEVQIDCHGATAKDAQALARAVDGVLRGGWSGTMDDDDSTVVQSILRLPSFVDGYNDASRTFVRSLEYSVRYVQI